jgi:hypothetical protein
VVTPFGDRRDVAVGVGWWMARRLGGPRWRGTISDAAAERGVSAKKAGILIEAHAVSVRRRAQVVAPRRF